MNIDNFYKTVFETEKYKHIKGFREKGVTDNGFCVPWIRLPNLLRLQSQMYKHAFHLKFEAYSLIEFDGAEWALNHFKDREIVSSTKIETKGVGIYYLYNVGFGWEWQEKK